MDRMNDFENLILVQSIRKVITMEHEELASRIIGYLVPTGKPVGLLGNFATLQLCNFG